MGAGAVAGGHEQGYLQFIDPTRTWLNNKRLITLHAWIVLLYVLIVPPTAITYMYSSHNLPV